MLRGGGGGIDGVRGVAGAGLAGAARAGGLRVPQGSAAQPALPLVPARLLPMPAPCKHGLVLAITPPFAGPFPDFRLEMPCQVLASR